MRPWTPPNLEFKVVMDDGPATEVLACASALDIEAARGILRGRYAPSQAV
jgi:hypothetical protein